MLQRSRVRARVSARAIATVIDPPRIEPELSIGRATKALRNSVCPEQPWFPGRMRGSVLISGSGGGKADAARSTSAWRRWVSASHQPLHTNPIVGPRNAIFRNPLPFPCQGVFQRIFRAKDSLPGCVAWDWYVIDRTSFIGPEPHRFAPRIRFFAGIFPESREVREHAGPPLFGRNGRLRAQRRRLPDSAVA